MSGERSSRMRKVDELVREVLAEEVPHLKDPRIGFVTVTGVSTSPDLRHAIVYYSVLGSDEEKADTAAGLQKAAPYLQSRLGRQIRMKFTPKLRFAVDPSIDEGLRMSRIIHEVSDIRNVSHISHLIPFKKQIAIDKVKPRKSHHIS